MKVSSILFYRALICLFPVWLALGLVSVQAQNIITIDGKKASSRGILAKLKNTNHRLESAVLNQTMAQKSLRPKALSQQGGVRGLMHLEKVGSKTQVGALSSQEAKSLVKELMATGLYDYVEPDWIVTTQQVPTDTAFTNGALWGLRNTGQNSGTQDVDVNAVPAWALTRGSPNVIVGVIDSGIRYTHQDLAANMWRNTREIAGNGIDDDANGYVDDVHGINGITNSGDPMDDNNHGTHCAGTIAATANNAGQHVGVAYNVRLMGLKFLSASGSGATSDAIKCINYGVAHGATILSNSWGGGGYSQSLNDAIAAASQAGVLFIAAAGNSATNNDLTPHYPSNYDTANMVSVAAITRTGALASFSCFGRTTVDIAAPGVEILSCTATSDTSYASFQGTSMATPHVAGVAALVRSLHPAASMIELKNRLLVAARPLASLQGRILTGGMVDANAALTVAADGVLELRASAQSAQLNAGSNAAIYIMVSDLLPVTGATVTGTLGAGAVVPFLDNGVLPDVSANDGTYSANFSVPQALSTVNLSVQASAPSVTAASATFPFTIITPPVNDLFANRVVLAAGSTQTRGSNRLAGSEVGERRNPSTAGGVTVWWEWEAGSSGSFTITTSGSSFDTTMAIYSGTASLTAMNLIGSNDDSSGLTSSVTFNAVTGQRFFIQVDGYSGDVGDIVLNYPAPVSANSPPVIAVQPVGAQMIVGDPLSLMVLANGSVPLTYQWFFENAPISNARSALYTLPAVQKVNEGNYSVVITNPFGSITSSVVFVGVDPISVRPSNDAFATAEVLPGATGRVNGTNLRASAESGEPNHASASTPIESVWFRWTAPSDGVISFNTYGSSLDTTLAAYTGTAVGALTARAANNDTGGVQSFISTPVVSGQQLSIAVDGAGTLEGIFSLNYYFQPTVPGLINDSFANRSIVPGVSATVTGSNISATEEPGEPIHSPLAAPTASVWWEWTAPTNGVVVVDTFGSDFDSVLAVYTGSDLNALSLVTGNDDAGSTAQSRATWNCVAGLSYLIAVDGRGSAEGTIKLNLSAGIFAPEIGVSQPETGNLVDGVSQVNFGGVTLGLNRTLAFTITNSGGADLNGLGIVVDGNSISDFSQPGLSATTLPAGQSTSFLLQFSPQSLGQKSITLRLTSNDGNESPFDISIVGSGLPAMPEISLETAEGNVLTAGASSVFFGSVARGLSRSQTFVIRNLGQAALSNIATSLSGLQSGDYSFLTLPPAVLPAGTSASFVIRFFPAAIGSRSAVLSIVSDDADESSFLINLNGRASNPAPNLGFQISELKTTNAQVIDHFGLTGDDRGGIALSSTRVFVTGDSATAGYNLADLSDGASIGRVANGLCTDLATNQAYVLAANGTETSSAGTVNQLIPIHATTGARTTPIINLGQAVVMGSGSGIFSGYGRVVLHTGTDVFEVRVPSGEVIPQGSMRRPTWNASENWAVWGVAEDFGGYLYLAYATGATITRARVPDGATSVISTFTNLADMANWVASPSNNRWYFHHEFTSQFGGGSEILGFADASYLIGPPAAAPDITNSGTALAFVGGGFFYQITATNQPTSFSATSLPPGLVVNPANGSIIGIPTAVGVYDCTLKATNEVGSDSQIIRITTRMPLPSLSDDFDPGIDGNLWSEFGGTVTANTLGQQAGAGSTGNSLYFAGEGSRFATTYPIDTRTLTAVSFTVALANGPSGNWESVDTGEEPVLEYALDGRNFTRLGGPYYNRAWRSYVVAIPAAARSVATSFRWRQLSASGTTFDQWALEDVVIGSGTPLAPEISVDSPLGTEMVSGVSTVSYGGVGVTLTSSRSFTVRNDGGAELNHLNVMVTGADANEFRVQSPPAASIPSGATSSFNLIFAPTSPGLKQANLRIASNDADESIFQLVVTGSGLVLAPDIAVEQPSGSGLVDGVSTVNFGNTLATQAVQRTFTIRNTGVDQLGGIALNILGQDADLFTVVSSPSSTVSAGGSTSFTVRYLPTIQGQQSAVLLITSNDLDENPFEITLAGTADAPLAYYSIFANQAYVSTASGSTYARMVQLLQEAGNAVVDFTGTTSTDWDAAFNADAVLIPPLEGLPIPMDQDSADLIRLRTAQGKCLIVVGKNLSYLSSDAAFLNSTFGWSLIQGSYYNSNFLNLRMPTNRFPQSPNVIAPRSSSAPKFKDASLPIGAQRIYANDVTTMSFYKGSIAYTADEITLGTSEFDAFFGNLCPFILRNGSIADMRVQTPDATMQADTGAEMDLGATAVGTTTTYGLNITNTGSQPLTGLQASFSGVNATDFSLAAALPAQLAEGVKYTVNVRMRPSASGIRTAKLTLTSNAYYSPVFEVQLSGTGGVGAPEFSIPSSSFDESETLTKAPLFFASNYSSVSSRAVTIYNLGTAPLGIKSVEITGRFAGDFILRDRSPLSLQIPVGGMMSIPVTYRGSFFEPAVAQMRILTNDTSESVFDLMLINGDQNFPSIFVSNDTDNRYHYETSNLSFGTLTLGLSTVKRFTIGNNGGFNLTGISLTKSGPHAADYIVSALPTSSLIPGASQSFTVTFNPKNGGFRNATLRLTSNSVFDNPLIINLSAYVDAAEIQVADAVQTNNIYVDGKSQLPFGLNLRSGQSVTRGLMVSNQGTRPMTIGETVIDGPNAAAFSITQFDTEVLNPSGFSPLGLRFQGSLPGTYNATLHIVSSDVDESPFDLKLTAHVAEPDIGLELSPKRTLTSNLDVVEFADVKAPTLVSRKITIRNLGNAVLNLNSATITGLGSGSFGLRDFSPIAIPPKGSTAVYLDYSATAQRNLAASFRVMSNDPDEAVFHLDLLGIGHQEYAPQVLGAVQDQIAYAGQPVSFVSQFEGYQSNVYQWFKGPTPVKRIPRSNSRMLTLPAAKLDDGRFHYYVTAVNPGGQAQTAPAVLTVVERKSTITSLPEGAEVSFSVNATSSAPLSYVWFKAGVPLIADTRFTGLDGPVLKISNLELADAGIYSCEVTGTAGALFSGQSTLGVYNTGPEIMGDPLILPSTGLAQEYSYEAPLNPASGVAVSYTAKGLPRGLVLNAQTGIISGRATQLSPAGGRLKFSLTATNSFGSSTVQAELEVTGLPAGVARDYSGMIARGSVNGELGGRADFTISNIGRLTGKLRLGKSTLTLPSSLITCLTQSQEIKIGVTIPRPGLSALKLDMTLSYSPEMQFISGGITGQNVVDCPVTSCWPRLIGTLSETSVYSGYHTFSMSIPTPLIGAESIPQGQGYASFTIPPKGGAFSFVGRLPDGDAFTAASLLAVGGNCTVYTMLPSAGSLHGEILLPAPTQTLLQGDLTWSRPASLKGNYMDGLGPLSMGLLGGRFTATSRTQIVLGKTLPATPGNARLAFLHAGLLGPPTVVDRLLDLTPGTKLSFPGVGITNTTFTVNAITGVFGGKFNFNEPHPYIPGAARILRSATYQGLIIPSGTRQIGRGYFMLQQLPKPIFPQPRVQPSLSGSVLFE